MSAPASRGDAVRQGFFASVLEVLPESVLIHDEDTILFANAACRRFLCADSPDDLEGRPIDILVHADAREAGRERRRVLIESERALKDVPLKVLDLQGGTRYVTADAHPISFDGVKAAMVISPPQPA